MRSYCVGRADGLEYRVESKEWRCGVGSADNIASSERGAMGALYALNECVFASLPQVLSRQLSQRHKCALTKSKIWTLTYLSGEP